MVLTFSSNPGGTSIASSDYASPSSTVMWSVTFAPPIWPLGLCLVIAPASVDMALAVGLGFLLGIATTSFLTSTISGSRTYSIISLMGSDYWEWSANTIMYWVTDPNMTVLPEPLHVIKTSISGLWTHNRCIYCLHVLHSSLYPRLIGVTMVLLIGHNAAI
ncbi:hypothetical protein LIER_39202 [Lithospermum erythrorhizon]|uniref:NADH dehydrogenase subunit 6 n=1 Tax=Lithospermum erythrorhizon TaxID=34254 RepID=A0AAV3QCE3_LITER